MSIKLKVALVIIGIVTVVTAAQTGISLLMTRINLEEMVQSDLAAVTERAEVFVNKEIVLLQTSARMVAQKASGVSPDKLPEIFQQAQDYHPDFLAFAVFDHQGAVATWGDLSTSNYLETTANLQKAFQGESSICTAQHVNHGEKLAILLYVPLNDGRVLSVAIDGLYFQSYLTDYSLWNTGKIYMIDKYGTFIIHPRPDYVSERFNFLRRKNDPSVVSVSNAILNALQNDSGISSYDYQGQHFIFAWRTLTNDTEGWVLGVSVPLQDTPMFQDQKTILWAAAIFLGLAILAALFFSGRAARPFMVIEKQNQDLKDLNEVIVASDEAKTHFLANMSHEMRTPLNAIIGLAELSLNATNENGNGNGKDKSERAENLEKILSAGTTLLGIINDILDVSKISSGKFEIIPVDYDLSSLINDTVTQNMVSIADRPIKLELNVSPDLPSRLFGDDLRVRQIFNNLISNAFKYTRSGTVWLNFTYESWVDDDIWLIFSVKDTGIGIRSEDLGKIFGDYTQLDTRANRMIQGTGLGLSVARQLVTMMDGNITVESEYGRGTTFEVRVRQKRMSAIPLGEEIANNLMQLRFNRVKLRRSTKLSRKHLPYARVLVVDDVPTNLDVARGLMKPYGMQVDCVESGLAAIELIREARVKYNAIFMDHMMPIMDGLEAVRIIREEIDTEYARTVPIIALTANAVVGTEKMFLRNGFQAFISKPIDIVQLDSMIRQWVRDKDYEEKILLQTSLSEEKAQELHEHHSQDEVAAPETEKEATPAQSRIEIDGLNMTKGLARFSGDMETYLQILHSYASHTPALLEKVAVVTPETLSDYSIIVHGIKGSSYNIGADVVGSMAEALEKAGKAGDLAFVQSHNPPFIETAKLFLAELTTELKARANPKPARDEPDPATLEVLRQACETFDIDKMTQAMKSLTGYEYNSGTGADLVAWLEEKTFLLDFKQIAKRLAENRQA